MKHLLSLLFLCISGNAIAQNQPISTITICCQQLDSNIHLLQNFYRDYIAENDKRTNEAAINSIKERYITAELLDKIGRMFQDGTLDYDPFVNAQDYDSKWPETLQIEKCSQSENTYIIHFPETRYGKHQPVKLIVDPEQNKISDILF